MPLVPSPDAAAADWLTRTAQPWQRLVEFGAAGFPAYARLRFLPDPRWAGQQEADVRVADDLPLELDQLRTALGVLAGHTTTAGDCYFCLWDGWGLRPAKLPGQPVPARVDLPHRRYYLYRGSCDDLGQWGDLLSGASSYVWSPLPAFVWPTDRAWCVARDVDPHFAGIGADAAAVRDLLEHPGLDVVTAAPDEEVPHYY